MIGIYPANNCKNASMSNHTIRAKIFLSISLLCTTWVCVMIGSNSYSVILPFLWAIAVVSVGLSGIFLSHMSVPRVHMTPRSLLIGCIILLPVIVRVANYQPNRIHGDDLLTATFSQEFHPLTTNFFAGVPEGTEWVAKFPAPYFLFQKIFLRMTGASVLTVKLSVLPYVLFVSYMTYIIGSMLFGAYAGASAVVIYAFMAISVYHETLGLHFISSTAIYMLFFYAILRSFRTEKPAWFVISGITMGACYLSYTSSYIALPVMGAAMGIYAATTRKKQIIYRWIIWALLGCVITLAPFITYAITQENYFGGRINQVSLLTGSWSSSRLKTPSFPLARDLIIHNTDVALRSMIHDGIGGHGGYTFNQRAFFHPLGLVVFLAGLMFITFKKSHRKESLLIFITIAISFLTGVVLTIPPPAYHRLTLTFPFIALISAAPFSLLAQKKFFTTGIWFACVTLAVFAGVNLHYFKTSVRKEALIEDAAIIQHINQTYPNRHIHIAAFPSFALEKLYMFFTPKTALSIDTRYHLNYLQQFNRNEPYVYVITLPREFEAQFRAADPNGTITVFSDKYWFMVNEAP